MECASSTIAEIIKPLLLSAEMASFSSDTMSHSPEVVGKSFFFLCFTYVMGPGAQLCQLSDVHDASSDKAFSFDSSFFYNCPIDIFLQLSNRHFQIGLS